jgi:hypothetical protein
MLTRLLRVLASPALILVWLAVGVGLIGLGLYMGLNGIQEYSGTVKSTRVDPQFGTHVRIDSSSLDFFFDSGDFPQLPDVRVGDQVEILTTPQPVGWSIAVESQRGTWIDSIYGHEVAPYTPRTWPIHEAQRWMALALGTLLALFGLASLMRWIPSPRQQPAPGGAQSSRPLVQESAGGSTLGVQVGILTVIALPILEIFAVTGPWGNCRTYQLGDLMLVAVSLALAGGGITSLILSAREAAASPRRTTGRRLGIVAIVMAVVSLPINVFLVGLSGFCATG